MRNMTLIFLSLFFMGAVGCVNKPVVVQQEECKPLPEIQADQSLKDYTVLIVKMYTACATLKGKGQ